MDALLGDAEVREAVRRFRPNSDATEALARVAWSVVAEPGDGVSGALIRQLGAADALRFALAPDDLVTWGLDAVGEVTARTNRTLQEGRRRWTPRADVRSVRDALRGAHEVSARLVIPGDAEWPEALDDLAEHAPLLLWARGDARHLAAEERYW
ncbi:hypothetical protein DC31_09915 [Microbacterium sp. CH12i]|nr:hypothetical protein DC31_09915 [Microbacterium sp. CH12i]